MKDKALVLITLALVVWLVAGAPRASERQAPAAAAGDISILVRLGVGDREPTDWSGALTVTGGEAVGLRSWRPYPGDEVKSVSAWSMTSRRTPAFQNRAWEDEPMHPYRGAMWPAALVVELKGAAPAVEFRTAQGNFSVRAAELRGGEVRRFLGGRATVERTPAAVELSAAGYESEFVDLAAGAGKDLWAAWTGYRKGGNAVFVRRYDGARWLEPQAITTGGGDVFIVKLARDGAGGMWAVWSEQVNGNWDLYARRYDGKTWGARQRLTEHPQPDLFPAMTTDAKGQAWVAWQGFRGGKSDIFVRRWDGVRWSPEEKVSG